jgi:hypothetical protein
MQRFTKLYTEPHGFDVISVINDHVLDRVKVDGQGVLVVESDASHFTYGRSSILVGSGNLVSIVLRLSCNGQHMETDHPSDRAIKTQNSDNWFRCTEQTYE